MQPFSRETIVDRRQGAVRWSAVLAGSAIALATWMLLQLAGSGIALSALDAAEWDRVHAIGIGSSAWSVIAAVISLFVGGLLAGRLDGHHDKKVAALHGLLVWAITGIIGVLTVSSSISMMSAFPSRDLAVYGAEVRSQVIDAANTTGNAMLIASLAILLGGLAAVVGSLVSAHTTLRHRRHDTIPGHTTAPYPVQPDPQA
jgi:MFS family permease